jgi:hypothetical protein
LPHNEFWQTIDAALSSLNLCGDRFDVSFELTDNNQAFCWLRKTLEPDFQVITEPSAGYFSEFLYCYRVLDGDRILKEFRGDFRNLQRDQLENEARAFVGSLKTAASSSLPTTRSSISSASSDHPVPEAVSSETSPVVASRLIPLRTDVTYFGSGRAAFTYLIGEVVRPERVWLPTFVCWSLISAMQQRFPQTPLKFYTVDRGLKCEWPATEPGDAVVFIHFFGHISEPPRLEDHCTQLEDLSHVLISPPTLTGHFGFGSLRKLFRIADGGQLLGRHSPIYETDDGLTVWLRATARDWRDLREAENMMDRRWQMTDMSSQSMAQMLSSNVATMADQRRRNQRFLNENFPVGQPLIAFRPDEVPLLQNVLLPDQKTRDDLRAFLATRGVFCSIHWPLHPLLRQLADDVDCTDAAWLEDHVLSIPIADDFDESRMAAICEAATEWRKAGG